MMMMKREFYFNFSRYIHRFTLKFEHHQVSIFFISKPIIDLCDRRVTLESQTCIDFWSEINWSWAELQPSCSSSVVCHIRLLMWAERRRWAPGNDINSSLSDIKLHWIDFLAFLASLLISSTFHFISFEHLSWEEDVHMFWKLTRRTPQLFGVVIWTHASRQMWHVFDLCIYNSRAVFSWNKVAIHTCDDIFFSNVTRWTKETVSVGRIAIANRRDTHRSLTKYIFNFYIQHISYTSQIHSSTLLVVSCRRAVNWVLFLLFLFFLMKFIVAKCEMRMPIVAAAVKWERIGIQPAKIIREMCVNLKSCEIVSKEFNNI